MIPPSGAKALAQLGGLGSELHRKYAVYVQAVGMADMPEDYDTRLTEMFPGAYARLRLYAFEAHDLALSKLGRNNLRDQGDVPYLAKAGYVDPGVLVQRYQNELRSYLANVERHDLTIRLWVEMIQEIRGA